jgi:large subunit ribosomal protein L25
MKLTTSDRTGKAKRLRTEGMIPAIIYVKKGNSRALSVPLAEFEAALRSIPRGNLSTTIFTLNTSEGEVRALVKDIQYHVTTYNILHLDFQELKDGVTVNVNVPVHLVGGDRSPGVKLGGVVRPVIRTLRVNCLPKQIPTQLVLDVSDLSMGQTMRLRDIALEEGVKPLAKMDEVAVVIAKR